MKWICRGCQKENRKFKPCTLTVEGGGMILPHACPFAIDEDGEHIKAFQENCEWKVIEATVGRKRKGGSNAVI